MMATFWMFNPARPARPILRAELPLLHCERTAWAVLPSGARRLVGVSAFFTEASARRAQIGALEIRARNGYARRFFPRQTAFYAERLKQLKSTIH